MQQEGPFPSLPSSSPFPGVGSGRSKGQEVLTSLKYSREMELGTLYLGFPDLQKGARAKADDI